jgi:hypothetical protein
MFTIDAKITDLKIKERNLYKVLFSMNIHQVATPELSAEDTKSYVFFFREGGKYLSYIGLHFLHTDRKMYYSHSANPFSESELPAVEEEARSFAEDMGAMLDELALVKMSDVEKDRWIDEQDIFSTVKKTREAAPEQAAAAGVDQGQSAAQSATVAPPSPGVQPAPASAAEKAAPAEPAPRPAPAEQPLPEPSPAEQPAVETPVRPAPRAQRKQAAPRPSAAVPKTPVSVPEAPPAEDILQQGVEAGIVKAPKQPLKKDIRSANGAVGRNKEALARLLASF